MIDLRHYLDPELDMHHAVASFSVRNRMQRAKRHAANQIIWMARKHHEPIALAFEFVDRWLENIRAVALTSARYAVQSVDARAGIKRIGSTR